MRKISGFTIIELVVVITILGILAAVALPKFFDVQADAQTASAAGVAGALSSGSAVNYGARLAKGTITAANGLVSVAACTATVLGRVLTGAVLPTNISVTEISLVTATAGGNGTVGLCGVYHTGGGTTTTASIIVVVN